MVGNNHNDINGHGSIMYYILKGSKNNFLGISPDVSIISIKILDVEESITPEKVLEAINLAIDKNATVINLSIGSFKNNEVIKNAIDNAVELGITVVASSGDYSNGVTMFPANLDNVISVGALDERGEVLELTSGAELTTLNAPGTNITSLNNDGDVMYSSGTSQASVLVAGYIALLKDYAQQNSIILSNAEIRSFLEQIKSGEIHYNDVFDLIKE